MISAVLFDLDGVIVDSFSMTIRAFKEAYASKGFSVTDEYIRGKIGSGAERNFRDYFALHQIQFSQSLLDELLACYKEAQEKYGATVTVFDGFYSLFERLSGKKMAVATMSYRIPAQLKLSQVDATFDAVVTLDDVSRPKPFPDIFLEAAKRLGKAPENCVVIEDAIYGVEAAKKAGMKCIGVTTGHYGKEALEKVGADLVVHSLSDPIAAEFIEKN